MHQSVRDYFVEFSSKLEGVVPYFYLDILGLVTVGIGNLVDPIAYALKLPMVHKDDGRPATTREIEIEWRAVKADPLLAKYGHKAAARVTALRLTEQGLHDLVVGKLDEVDRAVSAQFGEYENWSSDAQLGILSMAWAAGAGIFHGFPAFSAACRVQDFDRASAECNLQDAHNPGLRPRNEANRHLFRNAAVVVANGMDPEVLWYPESPVIPDAVPLPFRHG